MGALLSRDSILKAHDRSTEEVRVPEWADSETGADTVLVRALTGRERDQFEADSLVRVQGQMEVDPRNARARLVALCVVGEDGKPLFTRDDVAALGEKSAAALDRIFAVASRLSGLGADDMKELERDFGSGPGGGSFSTSPNGSAKPLTAS